MPRITRKPVPQISTCTKCGNEFKYLRTLRHRILCNGCTLANKAAHNARWNAKREEARKAKAALKQA